MLPGTLRRHKKRVTNKITLTKTILKRKIGAGVEFDSLPSNFEENKTNLKILFQLYEELAKSSVQLKSHEMNEVIAGKSLSSAISNFSDPLLSSHSSSNLGQLIREYCQVQNVIEDLRESTFISLWEKTGTSADSFIIQLQQTKQVAERVSKSHLELSAAANELAQLVGENNFQRSVSFSPYSVEQSQTSLDDRFDHAAVFKGFLNYHRANRRFHNYLLKSTHAFEDTFIQRDVEAANQIVGLYNAQKIFYDGAYYKFRQLEQRYNIREAFELSEQLISQTKKQREECNLRDKKRREERKWVSLLEFIDSIGTALLSLTTDPTEEQILLEMVAKSFHAYNMAIPWIVKLISVEVAATTEPTTLLRGNIFVTKVVINYMKFICGDFLFAQMSELTLEALKSDRDYEVDPTKNTESDSIQSNMNDLITLSERFLKLFIDALPSFPPVLFEILSHLREETDKKFEGKGTTFAGAFLFLRFICPALVFPEKNQIVPEDTIVSKQQRRCLMLVSKALQNLANGVQFREQYMELMNEAFLAKNLPLIQDFFLQITRVQEGEQQEVDSDLLAEVNQTELPYIYNAFYNNMSKLAKHFEEAGTKEKILELGSILGKMSILVQQQQTTI